MEVQRQRCGRLGPWFHAPIRCLQNDTVKVASLRIGGLTTVILCEARGIFLSGKDSVKSCTRATLCKFVKVLVEFASRSGGRGVLHLRANDFVEEIFPHAVWIICDIHLLSPSLLFLTFFAECIWQHLMFYTQHKYGRVSVCSTLREKARGREKRKRPKGQSANKMENVKTRIRFYISNGKKGQWSCMKNGKNDHRCNFIQAENNDHMWRKLTIFLSQNASSIFCWNFARCKGSILSIFESQFSIQTLSCEVWIVREWMFTD